jgi:hypothetical protein
MATCTVETGMLFWKKVCNGESIGNCRDCRRFVCQRHASTYGDGSLVCTRCGVEVDDSTGTVFSTSGLGLGAGAAAGAAAAGGETTNDTPWHGDETNSSSSDSGSSDSGGGDSGGSSSD